MDHLTQQQIVLGNQQYPYVAPGSFNNPTTPDGKLWGATVRRIMGILQIVCGVIEFVLGIAVIVVPGPFYSYSMDYVGWGILNGMFAMMTGFLGIYSLRRKCMVISYMVTSIIAAGLCAGCFIYAVFGTLYAAYGYNEAVNLAMYVILCIIFFIQMVISIIGASFTCGAVCSANTQAQQVVYYTTQPSPQQYVPTPSYTVAASQNSLTSQTATTSVNGAYVSEKV